MRIKIVFTIIALSLLLPLMLEALLAVPIAADQNIRQVIPGRSIQTAINEANPGDIISVASGTYNEPGLVVNKSLTLEGAGSDTTFIDGDGENTWIVSVTASNVKIRGFTIQNGGKSVQDPKYASIQIRHNISVLIRNNVIRKSDYGILLSESNSSSITNNTITDNYAYGIKLTFSSNNLIVGNNITNNPTGVLVAQPASQSNVLYHNNFLNNTNSAVEYSFTTQWDDGYPSGGNYWSDYTGVDMYSGVYQDESDSDGIGDAPYPDEGPQLDRYPLMGPVNIFDTGTWNNVAYHVNVASNSTVSNFYFNPDEGAIITFNVNGPGGTSGFCRVTIPQQLLSVDHLDEWAVCVDNNIVNFTVTEDRGYTYFYFIYNHSVKTVKITGIHVVPEFSVALFLPILVVATLIAIVLARRKESKDIVKDRRWLPY